MSKLKIVCISNRVNDLNDWDREHFGRELIHLTIGKVYDGLNINEGANPYKNVEDVSVDKGIDIFVMGDLGERVWIPYYMFEPLANIRDKKLEELGI